MRMEIPPQETTFDMFDEQIWEHVFIPVKNSAQHPTIPPAAVPQQPYDANESVYSEEKEVRNFYYYL